MNLKRLVVCDRDKDYGSALTEYIRHSDCGYEVILYTEPERFLKDCMGGHISLLLMQEGFLASVRDAVSEDDVLTGITADRQFVLTENRDETVENSIYKYQSAAMIINGIGEDIEAAHRITNEAEKSLGMKLIGVYSPIGHTLKTTFAMTLGRIMAEHEPVLYINMEGYNGLSELLDIRSEYGMMDLMYEYSLHPDELAGMLAKYIFRFDELDVLIPVRSPFELQEIEPSMWLSLFGSLTCTGRYGAVIIDISDAIRGIPELLNVCTDIYMPVRKDAQAMAKLKDFEYVLSGYPGADKIRSKLIRLKFPYFDDIDGLSVNHKNSRLGRYIRQEIYGKARQKSDHGEDGHSGEGRKGDKEGSSKRA